jgi:hypothetical protein
METSTAPNERILEAMEEWVPTEFAAKIKVE